MDIKAIIIPGNGDDDPKDKWFPWLKNELEKISILTENVKFPDPILARAEFWLPFIEELGADEKTILIGHSSGAVAAMRFAETHKILGSILVGACYTDLGDDNEKKSDYYNRPWNWNAIKENQRWIIQFASTDDPYIPIGEARFIHKQLKTDYREYTNEGHFGSDKNKKEFPEIIEAIKIHSNKS
jgi:uncharacterized protein